MKEKNATYQRIRCSLLICKSIMMNRNVLHFDLGSMSYPIQFPWNRVRCCVRESYTIYIDSDTTHKIPIHAKHRLCTICVRVQWSKRIVFCYLYHIFALIYTLLTNLFQYVSLVFCVQLADAVSFPFSRFYRYIDAYCLLFIFQWTHTHTHTAT